jgi:hypothetical protein
MVHTWVMVDDQKTGAVARFSLVSLVTFSVALVAAGGLLGYVLQRPAAAKTPSDGARASTTNPDAAPAVIPAWGELVTSDIELEAPEEYVAYELKNIRPPQWQFPGLDLGQVRGLLGTCGLTPEQIARGMAPGALTTAGAVTLIRPDDELVLSLAPDSRRRLYRELGQLPGNELMQYPYIYPTGAGCLRQNKLGREVNGMIRKLLYPRGDNQCFSDINTVMGHVTNPADRLKLLMLLSRQPAVEASLRIRPNTDVEKVLGYWGKGARLKDLRPLLESMTRVPDGGQLSLLHLLPPFARQRLHTFPMPAQPGDPNMDCHWSALNFFNETPDNRLGDPGVAVGYIQANYYPIAEPTSYGDLICFADDKGRAFHSAVYLAGDLVFTKNGNNMAQPWKLARLGSLKAYYELDVPTRMYAWRRKNM